MVWKYVASMESTTNKYCTWKSILCEKLHYLFHVLNFNFKSISTKNHLNLRENEIYNQALKTKI
jgi:hypothetical protein